MAVVLVTAAAPGCFLWTGDRPTTWQGRYDESKRELAQAPDEQHRFYVLNDVAKASFEVGRTDEARGHAEQLLQLAERFRGDWNYGNAVHDGHMVLGRVALRNGDAESAKRELLLAGKTPGSPQLNSFGPNMSLARDLLDQKQTGAVVEYFGLCAVFWDMGRDRLRQWTVLARAGEMPEFEANLLY